MMAKNQILSLLAPLFCLSFLVAIGHASSAPQDFTIQGRVYCDTCRAGFETNVTEYIEGAKVRLECRHIDDGDNKVHHRTEGVTDHTGTYTLHIENDHQDELCEVVLVESPLPDCSEINSARQRARILLTKDSGMSGDLRFANPLGFLKEEPLPECGKLLQFYALQDEY